MATKTLLLTDIGALVGLAQIDPMTAGQQLGQMAAAGILGVVAVALVIANVVQWRTAMAASIKHHAERESHADKLSGLLEKTTAAVQKAADASDVTNDLLVEVKDSNIKVANSLDMLRKHCEDQNR